MKYEASFSVLMATALLQTPEGRSVFSWTLVIRFKARSDIARAVGKRSSCPSSHDPEYEASPGSFRLRTGLTRTLLRLSLNPSKLGVIRLSVGGGPRRANVAK